MTPEEKYIIDACRRNDPKAQKRLYDKYAPMVFGVCLRYVPSFDEAQDVLQEVFIKVFDGLGGLRNYEAIKAWICRIASRAAVNYLLALPHVEFVDISSPIFQDGLADMSIPEVPFDTDIFESDSVLHALACLPEKYRVIFNMLEVDDMSYSDVADTLGINESTARCYLSRAKKMLQEKLQETL